MIKRVRRDLWRHRGWAVAVIILLALSAGIYSSFRSTYDSGLKSFNDAKAKLNSAQITVNTAVTGDLSAEIKKVRGVDAVSPAYLTEVYTLAKGKKVRGVVNGVASRGRVEGYQILRGRDFKKINEVVVEHHYADKHNIKPGSKLTIYNGDQATDFKVVGVCFSPDYIYLISPEGAIEKDMGVFFVSRVATNDFFTYQFPHIQINLVNTYYIKTRSRADINKTATALQALFRRHKINALIKKPGKTFADNAFKEDLGAMNSLANIFSLLLLAVSAFTLFVVLSRIIERRRHEIGTLRALGFKKSYIFFYYLVFTAFMTFLGVIVSIPLGIWSLSGIINYWGVNVLGIPKQFITYNLNTTYVVYSAVFTLAFSFLGAFVPAYRAASLTPAEAMRPFISAGRGTRLFSRAAVSPTKKLVLRDLFGYRARSLSTIVSVALVLALELSFVLSMGSLDDGVIHRFDHDERWNIKVILYSFGSPESALRSLRTIKGVTAAEPLQAGGAELKLKGKNTVVQFNEIKKDTAMRRFPVAAGGRVGSGLLITSDVAYRLGAKVGDRVTVNSPLGKSRQKITGILTDFGASEAYLLQTPRVFNNVLLRVRPGEVKSVSDNLKRRVEIKSWVTKDELRDGWLYLMDEYYGMVYVMDLVTIVLVLIAVGVFAFISTMEREWEFVVLKAMGYRNTVIQVGALMETLLLVMVGIVVGVPIGRRFAALFNDTFKSLIAPPPITLNPALTLSRAALVIIVALLTVYLVIRFTLKRNIAAKLRQVFEAM